LRFLPSVLIDVIPNGVDLDRFYPAQTDGRPDVLRLLTVGRLSVTKRVEILVDTVEILHREGYRIRFTVVGGGPMEQELRQAVLEKNLGDIVEITGRTSSEDMPQMYRQNDIFVSASMQEGMSNAMLEAMASGLPIITTRCEGLEELIADNGLIVEQANAEAIAGAIKKLADDRPLCKKMALAARKQAEQLPWSRTAESYLALYERLK
jgi:glycosyltransferase involved in cell wall biosynthesis